MAQSILLNTKKVLGLAQDDTSFDQDVLMHINSVFATLNQIGIGPAEGFEIEGPEVMWDAFVTDPRLNPVKSYMYLRLRVIFDPPSTSYAIESMAQQIKEFEWRLNVEREGAAWTDPNL